MKYLSVLLLCLPTFSAEPTPEQMRLMREYGLSVPPVIIRENHESEKVAIRTAPTGDQTAFMREHGLTVPPVFLDASGKPKKSGIRVPDIGDEADKRHYPIISAINVSAVELKTTAKSVLNQSRSFEEQCRKYSRVAIAEIVPLERESSGKVVALTAETFNQTQQHRVSVVEFGASWCAYCRLMAISMDSLAKDMKTANFFSVDIDKSPSLASRFGVVDPPLLVVFVGGKEFSRHSGFMTKNEISEMTQSALRPRALPASSTPTASGITEEQRALMQRYHLSVPPTIIH